MISIFCDFHQFSAARAQVVQAGASCAGTGRHKLQSCPKLGGVTTAFYGWASLNKNRTCKIVLIKHHFFKRALRDFAFVSVLGRRWGGLTGAFFELARSTTGWFFSRNTFDESVTSLYHFSLWEKKILLVFWGRLFRFLEIYGPKWDFCWKCSY
jgi:hypothetical protein